MLWRVPPLWSGERVFILGGGPSLRQFDVSRLRGRRVLAINDAFLLAPFADLLYFGDWRWLDGERADPRWSGPGNRAEVDRSPIPLRVTRADNVEPWPDWLRQVGFDSRAVLSRDTSQVAGRSGGANALNIARHGRAASAVLLGFDMRPGHWHDRHGFPSKPENYANRFIPELRRMAPLLAADGMDVLNATPGSALDAFPFADIEALL